MKSQPRPPTGVLSDAIGQLALPRLSDGRTMSWANFPEIVKKAATQASPKVRYYEVTLDGTPTESGGHIYRLEQWRAFLGLDPSSKEVPFGTFQLNEARRGLETDVLSMFSHNWRYQKRQYEYLDQVPYYQYEIIGGIILDYFDEHIVCELVCDKNIVIIDRWYCVPKEISRNTELIKAFIEGINPTLLIDEFGTFEIEYREQYRTRFDFDLRTDFQLSGASRMDIDISSDDFVSIVRCVLMLHSSIYKDIETSKYEIGAIVYANPSGDDLHIAPFIKEEYQNSTFLQLPEDCDAAFSTLLKIAVPRGFGIHPSFESRNWRRVFPALRLTTASVLLNDLVILEKSAALRAVQQLQAAEFLKAALAKIGI